MRRIAIYSLHNLQRIMYIYQHKQWPSFTWKKDFFSEKLARVCYKQGMLLGRMEGLGFDLREEASLQTITTDVLKSSEIEGEQLDRNQVRSSIARKLGVAVADLVPSERHVDGVVEMLLDATQNYEQPLSKDRLFGWHAALFPTGRSGMLK